MDPNQKDPNVMSFMMQMVQEKHGDNIDSQFLEEEATKLYNQFGDQLVSYFEPMLTEEQKNQFDQLVQQNADQSQLLEFLIGAIDNLEQRIFDTLIRFKNTYMQQPATTPTSTTGKTSPARQGQPNPTPRVPTTQPNTNQNQPTQNTRPNQPGPSENKSPNQQKG